MHDSQELSNKLIAMFKIVIVSVTTLLLITDAQVTRPLVIFGDLAELQLSNNYKFNNVHHIEEDRLNLGNFIVADGNAIIILLYSGNVSILAGEPNESGYNEGVGTKAHFQQIMSFSQYSNDAIAAVDMKNHCIRKVIRDNQLTSTLVGQCGPQGSMRITSGPPLEVQLNNPGAIVYHEIKQTFFIGLYDDSTTGSIVKYDVKADLVSILTKEINSFSFMIFDTTENNLIVTRIGGILRIDTNNGNVSLISGSRTETLKTYEDISDGSLLGAKFKYLSELTWLIPDQVLVVGDSAALRVVNLVDDKVETLCKSSKSSISTVFGPNGTCGIQTPSSLTMMNGSLYVATLEYQSLNKVYRILQIAATVPKCVLPPDIENGDFFPRRLSYAHADVIQCTCQSPYALVGPHNLSCTRTGQWSNAVPKCSLFYIKRVSPLVGQAYGGTRVTAEGDFPSDVQVNLTSESGSITRLDFIRIGNRITFPMPAGREGSAAVISIGSPSGNSSDHSYKYNHNPMLMLNREQATIVSGGITLGAQGKWISSASEYKLELIYRGKLIALFCKTVLDTVSVILPNFKELQWFSDAQLNNSEELIGNISARLLADTVPVDGADNFSILIFQDPNLYNMTESFHASQSKPLVLSGTMLDLVTKKDDYNITIGALGHCSDVIIFRDRLECWPPYAPSAELDFAYIIKVQVGNLEFQPGYVIYDPPPTNVSQSMIAPILVPIVVSIIIVSSVVGIIMYRRRQSQKKQKFETTVTGVRRISHTATPERGLEMIIDIDLRIKVDEMRIHPSDLTINYTASCIGKGNFGSIYMGQLKLAGGRMLKSVAVKVLKAQDIDADMVENFLREATLLTSFRHVNILCTIGIVWLKGDRPKVVMPYMARGDLASLVHMADLKLTNGDLLHFCMQIAAGMEYLSNHKFVHRDLAARNCLVDDEFLVKISDFGMSRDVYDTDYYREGDNSKPKPLKWMAIESIKQGVYNTSTDVWAFGVTMWELCTRGSTPYPGIDLKELLDYLESGKRLNQPTYTHPEIYEQMLLCWYTDSQMRPSFQRLHKFLQTFLDDNSFDENKLDQPEHSYFKSYTKHIPGDYQSRYHFNGYQNSHSKRDPNRSGGAVNANQTDSNSRGSNVQVAGLPGHRQESLVNDITNTNKLKTIDSFTQNLLETNSAMYENLQ